MADREAEQLPVPDFHVVYTLPAEQRDLAWQKKAVVYGLLMKTSAETTLAIATAKRLSAPHSIAASVMIRVIGSGNRRPFLARRSGIAASSSSCGCVFVASHSVFGAVRILFAGQSYLLD